MMGMRMRTVRLRMAAPVLPQLEGNVGAISAACSQHACLGEEPSHPPTSPDDLAG